MPFDPNLPVEHTLADAAQMRAQFNGLADLIGTIPVGPQGPQGVPGTSVTGAVVDGVAALNPGDPATASASFDGALVHFSFGLTRGNDGTAGAQGLQGIQGLQGEVGPQGAPFTSFLVDAVTTLPASEPATATATFDGTFVRFAFGIPQGQQGMPGADGGTGPQGPQGPQGPGGEVSPEHLATAIAGTANNTNSIATLDIAISDPPTQSELTQVLAKLNELIVGLRRA